MKVRQHRGLTQEQVAEKAQLNLDDYIAMEEGKKLENKERLEKACTALDIRVKDLFDPTTNINYGENKGVGSGIGNYNTFNTCSLDDNKVIEDLTENLKYVTDNLDLINNFVKVMYENLEDTVFKNKLKEILQEHSKNKKKE